MMDPEGEIELAASLGTILGVWAHPDDEAYLSAGLMALARRRNQRVVVVHATRGEHGTPDAENCPPERLAEVRTEESARSLAAIGVTEHHFLDYADGAVADVPIAEGVRRISGFVADVGPDTILTFGPDGITNHPDHVAISDWVSHAWLEQGRRGRVLHAAVTAEWAEEWRSINETHDLVPSPSSVVPASELAVAFTPEGEILRQKIEALEAHESQTRRLEDLLTTEVYRRWWRDENFVALPAAS